MSSIYKHHKKGGSKLEGEGGEGGEKVIYILSVFSGEKSEIAISWRETTQMTVSRIQSWWRRRTGSWGEKKKLYKIRNHHLSQSEHHHHHLSSWLLFEGKNEQVTKTGGKEQQQKKKMERRGRWFTFCKGSQIEDEKGDDDGNDDHVGEMKEEKKFLL